MNDFLAVTRQVFVSYAHADNLPMDVDLPGWVSQFVERLKKAVVRHAGGANVTFWMDHRLEPQREVDDELCQRIRESAVILAFISPRYLESKWCCKEMDTFVAEVGGGKSSNRVFIVEVLNTKRESWHAALRGLSPVALWRETLVRSEPFTLGWPVPDPRADRDYWNSMSDLASVLSRQLDSLGLTHSAVPPSPTATSADTADQLDDEPGSALPEVSAGLLNVVLHAADDEDQKLISATQKLLGDLDVDAYVAPGLAAGESPAHHRAAVEQLLRSSDGVLVVYGATPPTWVQAKHAEVRRLLALERRGTYTGLLEGPPEPKLAHGLPPRGLMVLDCRQGARMDELSRFVRALRQQRESGSGNV